MYLGHIINNNIIIVLLIILPDRRCCYSHFTAEKTDAQREKGLYDT